MSIKHEIPKLKRGIAPDMAPTLSTQNLKLLRKLEKLEQQEDEHNKFVHKQRQEAINQHGNIAVTMAERQCRQEFIDFMRYNQTHESIIREKINASYFLWTNGKVEIKGC